MLCTLTTIQSRLYLYTYPISDQTVTRWSFKHFGSQPRWDNDKVQWWYGDAAKSLLMLPKEYFGTFDMILVDLSETVMSSLVTKELDIMAALSLLLRPEGIFVKVCVCIWMRAPETLHS